MINTLAGVIGGSAGVASLLEAGDRAVMAHGRVEAIVPAVTAALRSSAMKIATRGGDRDPGWFAGNLYVIIGWSSAQGCVLAYQFTPADLFEASRVTFAAYPQPAHVDYFGQPLGLQQIRDLAASQAVLFGHPVGKLTVATITEHGIAAYPPSDIACAVDSFDEQPREAFNPALVQHGIH